MEGARKRRPRGVASTNYLSWGYGRAFRSLCGKFSRPSEAFELTFNATLSTLVSTQRLRVWRPLNSTRMVRYLFLTTILDAWIGGLSRVPGRPGQRRSKLTEFEQVAGLFDRYSGGESSSRMCLSGMTPPFGNNGSPASYSCYSGASSGTNSLGQAITNCGSQGGVWFPDLRQEEFKLSAGVMVKF